MPTSAERQDWRVLVAIFWVTSMVEGIGVSQVFALLPADLSRMGVPGTERLSFIGLFSSLLFVVGMPLVPLWGVWADKYSRKLVIVRSALVEAMVFAAIALSREPWQLAASILLIGFQLGNTGVMLAAIRDATPRARLGATIGLFGASGPIGFAVGPALAGVLIDGLGLGIPAVFGVSALLSVGVALLIVFGSKEVRPEVVPTGRSIDLAYSALRGVLRDPVVRRIFLIFGTAFLAGQMARPYVPVLVERLIGAGPGLASGIALVAGTAALAGALVSPLGGAIGDRIGFQPVLVVSLLGGGIALALMPVMPGVLPLAAVALALAAFAAVVTAMVFGLLATQVPPERRSATLNLVYLPLYAAGITGPLIGSLVVRVAGVPGPFFTGTVVYLAGAIVLVLRLASTRSSTRASRSSGLASADPAADSTPDERATRHVLPPDGID